MKRRQVTAVIFALGLVLLLNPFYYTKFQNDENILSTEVQITDNTPVSDNQKPKDYEFQFAIFLSILFLSILFSIKLNDYLFKYRTEHNLSRLDLGFLIAFFILLFTPVSKINESEISQTENRTLAIKPKINNQNGSYNLNFGNEFANWFNDRFRYRYELCDFYYLLKLHLNKNLETKDALFIQKNNWFTRKIGLYNKNIKNDVIDSLNKFNEFCNENNIKLYILLVPYKHGIYQDELSEIYTKNHHKIINDFILDVIKNTNSKIIYPYSEMLEASKKDFMFYKADHHWTQSGAYIGYRALMDEIKKDFSYVKVFELSDYNLKKDNKVLLSFVEQEMGLGHRIEFDMPYLKRYSDKILDVQYNYFENKDNSLMEISYDNEKRQGKDFYYSNGSDIKAMLFGTSMSENLNNFLSYSFKTMKYYRLNGPKKMRLEEQFKIVKNYKDDILNYKPDVIVLCITAQNFNQVKDMFKSDKKD